MKFFLLQEKTPHKKAFPEYTAHKLRNLASKRRFYDYMLN